MDETASESNVSKENQEDELDTLQNFSISKDKNDKIALIIRINDNNIYLYSTEMPSAFRAFRVSKDSISNITLTLKPGTWILVHISDFSLNDNFQDDCDPHFPLIKIESIQKLSRKPPTLTSVINNEIMICTRIFPKLKLPVNGFWKCTSDIMFDVVDTECLIDRIMLDKDDIFEAWCVPRRQEFMTGIYWKIVRVKRLPNGNATRQRKDTSGSTDTLVASASPRKGNQGLPKNESNVSTSTFADDSSTATDASAGSGSNKENVSGGGDHDDHHHFTASNAPRQDNTASNAPPQDKRPNIVEDIYQADEEETKEDTTSTKENVKQDSNVQKEEKQDGVNLTEKVIKGKGLVAACNDAYHFVYFPVKQSTLKLKKSNDEDLLGAWINFNAQNLEIKTFSIIDHQLQTLVTDKYTMVTCVVQPTDHELIAADFGPVSNDLLIAINRRKNQMRAVIGCDVAKDNIKWNIMYSYE